MKKIIKKISIIIIVLIIILSLFYYLIFFLFPEKEIKQMTRCREIGNKVYQQDKEEWEDKNSEGENVILLVYEPEYYFNKRLNTCLYYGGYKIYYKDLVRGREFVKNSFTNEKIIFRAILNDKLLSGLSIDEFNSQKQKLFNE